MTTSRSFDVTALGNAIVDVLVHCDDALLDKLDLDKSTMSLVDATRAEEIYGALGPGIEISGGSAANTATGIASLGGRAAFIGKVADDELGGIFGHDLRATGVAYDVPAAPAGADTARCLVMVTPDAQRTMATHLGVAGSVAEADIDPVVIAASEILFIEGYLVGLPGAAAAIAAAVRAARRAGRRVALTLSDAGWVAARRDAFRTLVGDVDILVANEAEACELTRCRRAEAALETLAGRCAAVAVTCSERGALLGAGAETVAVPVGGNVDVVDTTGAGDLFAAGFLLGLARRRPLADCGRLGALAAAEVISHLGARPERNLAELAAAAGLQLAPESPG